MCFLNKFILCDNYVYSTYAGCSHGSLAHCEQCINFKSNVKPIKTSLKIYVAGPLNSEVYGYIQNMKNMLDVAEQLKLKGHYPYIPCLDLMFAMRSQQSWTYDDFFDFNQPWLEACDVLYYMSSSNGADKELAKAKSLGKHIYYSLEEVPAVE